MGFRVSTPIMELGSQNGPNSIMVVYMDPLGRFLVTGGQSECKCLQRFRLQGYVLCEAEPKL